MIDAKQVNNAYLLELLQNDAQILYNAKIIFTIDKEHVERRKKISYLILETRVLKKRYNKKHKDNQLTLS